MALALFLIAGFWLWKKATYYELRPSLLWKLISRDFSELKQFQERSNILLLGIGGEGHDSGDLTDTIMLASIGVIKKDVLLLSIPRDIWIPTFKDKLNAAYRFGEEKKPGSGLTLVKSSIEEIVGVPIHYAVLVDFEGFTKMIETLGGVNVKIDTTFTDNFYPIKGRENDLCDGDAEFKCRYESVTFTQGEELMNGERALKYVRSRYAEGEAGTDFSRSKRQQAVLLAIKNKFFSSEIITNIKIIKQFLKDTSQALKTDMKIYELMFFGRIFLENNQKIRAFGLTQDEPDKNHKGLLINPPLWQYDGKWVLVPKSGDYLEIQKYVNCLIQYETDCESSVN